MSYIKYHNFWVWLNAWLFLVDEIIVILTLAKYNPNFGFQFLGYIAIKELKELQKSRPRSSVDIEQAASTR